MVCLCAVYILGYLVGLGVVFMFACLFAIVMLWLVLLLGVVISCLGIYGLLSLMCICNSTVSFSMFFSFVVAIISSVLFCLWNFWLFGLLACVWLF